MEASAGRPRGLRVRTSCATEAEFIATFQRHTDDESVFAPTAKMIPEGADCAFSLELTGGEPMLRGLGVVLHSWPTADNPFGAAGVHIAIAQLTTGTQPIHDRLLEARARAEGRTAARARPARITQLRLPMTPDELERADNEFEDESLIRDVRRTITQEMQAAPVEMIDERASHTIRYEGPLRAPATLPPPARTPRPPALPLPAVVAATHEPAALPDPPTYPGPPGFNEPPTMPEASAFARGTPVPPEAAPPAAPPEHSIVARLASVRSRLAPVRVRLATWSAPARARLRPAWTRFVGWLRPAWTWLAAHVRRVVGSTSTGAAPWWRNARVAAVFAAGILVGVLASSWMRPKSEPKRVPVAMAAPAQCTPAPGDPAIAARAPVAAAVPDATVPKPAAPVAPKKPAKVAAIAKPAVAKPAVAPAKVAVAAKPPVAPAKVAVTAKPLPPATKPVAVAAKPLPPATKPAAVAAKPLPPATKPAAVAKGKKTTCSTLDCL